MIRKTDGPASSYVQNEPFEHRSYMDALEEQEDMINGLVITGPLFLFLNIIIILCSICAISIKYFVCLEKVYMHIYYLLLLVCLSLCRPRVNFSSSVWEQKRYSEGCTKKR